MDQQHMINAFNNYFSQYVSKKEMNPCYLRQFHLKSNKKKKKKKRTEKIISSSNITIKI